jgi:hypothetical protein
MADKEKTSTEKMKENFPGRELPPEQLDNVAGGNTNEMAQDCKFLNYMLGDKECKLWIPGDPNHYVDFPPKHVEDAWAKVGIKAKCYDVSVLYNKYYLDGKEITRKQAFAHAQKVLNKYVKDSDWM